MTDITRHTPVNRTGTESTSSTMRDIKDDLVSRGAEFIHPDNTSGLVARELSEQLADLRTKTKHRPAPPTNHETFGAAGALRPSDFAEDVSDKLLLNEYTMQGTKYKVDLLGPGIVARVARNGRLDAGRIAAYESYFEYLLGVLAGLKGQTESHNAAVQQHEHNLQELSALERDFETQHALEKQVTAGDRVARNRNRDADNRMQTLEEQATANTGVIESLQKLVTKLTTRTDGETA